MNLIGKKVRHRNMPNNIVMEIIRLHGEVATCLLPKSEWEYIYNSTLVNVRICHLNNLIEVNEKKIISPVLEIDFGT